MKTSFPHPADVHYFLEVAKTESISRAAERLGITQPSLSLAVKRLEDHLGVPLLHRLKTGVKLSVYGTRFSQQAQNLMTEWEKVFNLTMESDSAYRGRFTIGCHVSVGHYSLHRFLPKLLLDQPLIEIQLKHDLSRRINEDIISFRVDLGIIVNPIEHPDLVIRPLFRDAVSLYTTTKPTKNQSIDDDQLVVIADSDLLQSQFILKKLKSKTPNRFVHCSSLEIICQLVAAGAGIGILPGRVASMNKQLKRVEGAVEFHDQICLVYRRDFLHTPTHRFVAKFVEKSMMSNFAVNA